MNKLEKITPFAKNFAKWYVDVIKNGNLIQYGLVKGTIILKPNSYMIWKNIQDALSERFEKELGAQSVYLPLLIPLSDFKKEKDHVEGFSPELVTVTRVGEKEITPLVLRPTSEIVFAHLFKEEITSYKDLPKIYNQWANVVRWEKTTNPFLRTSEFLWQEGHTSHECELEATTFAIKVANLYANFIANDLAIASIMGKKTPKERFAGAVETFTIETMMKDFKALQSGTSHYLGQNFAKPLDITFVNKQNKRDYVHQTSWGVSTRLIGAIIMTHGDDRGIIIPPKIANIKIDLILIFSNKDEKYEKYIEKIIKTLKSHFKIRVFDNYDQTFGYKVSQSEIEGTPLRIEIGKRDLDSDVVTFVRRDTLEKTISKISQVVEVANKLLENIQSNLYLKSRERLFQRIVWVSSYDEFKEKIKDNFVICPFDGNKNDEIQIQNETQAIARCIPLNYDFEPQSSKCIWTGKTTERFVIFARSY